MVLDPGIFRDYDIRAIVPDQLDADGVRRIAQALVAHLKPKSMQVGRDMRVTSPEFHKAFVDELLKLGVDVVDLDLVSTDMLYFAAGTFAEDVAVNISASHNPKEYNGMKIVKKGAIAVSGDSGIYQIRDLATSNLDLSRKGETAGTLTKRDIMADWITHLLSFIDPANMKPFRVVSDTGNGMAGHFLPHLEKKLPWRVTRLFYELDGTFPNHVPSPLEPKNMQACLDKVNAQEADLGMVFDGDGDRVFLIDDKGRIVTGTVMTAIIAENLLKKHPDETILYNAIVGRVVPEVVEKNNGKSIRVRVGHTLIKEAMRKNNALFCGEHSGHYYFRDNFFADSAIIAVLLVIELMSVSGKKLSDLVDVYDKYSQSGEINFTVSDKSAVIQRIKEEYQSNSASVDDLDGISVWFGDWWFNVRPSNTENLLRLNIEADTKDLLDTRTQELTTKITSFGGALKE